MKQGFTRLLQWCTTSAFCFLAGCTTSGTGPVVITKVNPYHVQNGPFVKSEDMMLDFEQYRHVYGAIETSERRELYGNYYTIFWKTETKSPATVRFEYRQGKTGFEVHSEEKIVANPKRSNVTKFQITGDPYHTRGKVTQWKVSIIENGSVVADYKSYLWK